MALVHEALIGYLEDDYLSGPYMGGTNGVHLPTQFEVVIVDSQKNLGSQFEAQIINQAIANSQFLKGNLFHYQCDSGYLEGGYLEDAYLSDRLCVALSTQFEVVINDQLKNTGTQFEAVIQDLLKATGSQYEAVINSQKNLGTQFNASITRLLNTQFQVVLYNTTQTRVLCDFASRGLPTSQGGTGGQNWTATIGGSPVTKPGDFSPNNLNTDIVEQRWESTAGSISNVNLDCDTEIPQGVTIDTLAILDHNISPGGTITLLGSDDSNFATIDTTIPISITEENIYYIAPSFPTTIDQNRYWRLNINDSANIDNFLRIGTIIFGNSTILSEATCTTDKIKRTTKHFADRIRTEGFTTVSNDRALKRKIDMRFENIKFGSGDFAKLDEVFRAARTSLKCLWIPFPGTPGRFAVFGKIVQLPTEEHNVKSTTDIDMDLITFNLTVDESF